MAGLTMVLEESWHKCILVVTQDGLELFHCGDGVHGGAFVPVTVKLILPFAALHHLDQMT